ncbi:MAG: WHG domain-containing protein [Myxococcota bacterium]|nr:WHG domain-containing protein [Myxococcota bacterium]
MSDDAVELVFSAVRDGELTIEDLSTRRICAFLGKTTGVLYHRYSSLDAFLFAVGQRGIGLLGERLQPSLTSAEGLGDVAVAFVEFGLDHPALYELMFERRYDWAALRALGVIGREAPGSRLWDVMAAVIARTGSDDPETDGRLLWAGLHGLVSLAASGRANMRALDRTDREVACAAARALARRLVGGKGRR